MIEASERSREGHQLALGYATTGALVSSSWMTRPGLLPGPSSCSTCEVQEQQEWEQVVQH